MNFTATILLCLFFSFGFMTEAQDRWIEGEVRFSEDSFFTGHFKFSKHVEKEIIAIKKGNRILALPPKDILSAEGFVDGEVKKWQTRVFKDETNGLNVHMFLEIVYTGEKYLLYRKDLSFIKWSPYADIVCDAVAFDSYKHLINANALLLRDFETKKMVVINRPNAWSTNKFMINKGILCNYLDTDKKSLKEVTKKHDLKLDNLTDIVALFMILEDKHSHQLTYSGN